VLACVPAFAGGSELRGPNTDAWLSALQAGALADARAFYEVEKTAGARQLADDVARMGGRVVEMGREIRVADREIRSQVRTSSGSLFLVTWRLRTDRWLVEETVPLASVLFDSRQPAHVKWPVLSTALDPAQVLARLAQQLREASPSEASMRKEFLADGGDAVSLRLVVGALAAESGLPLISCSPAKDAVSTCELRAGGEALSVRMVMKDSKWRILAAAPGTQPLGNTPMGKEEALGIRELTEQLERAIESADVAFLARQGVDADGEAPRSLSQASAQSLMAMWHAAFPGFRVVLRTEDLIGYPADRMVIPFTTDSRVGEGRLRLLRTGGHWRIVNLVPAIAEKEAVEPSDLAPKGDGLK
jgi:hypothetical protein